jgi:alanine racemase
MSDAGAAAPSPRLIVDLAALGRNHGRLSALAPGAQAAAVVKADAYGLDAERLGSALAAVGCRTFFTATASEGAALRAAVGPDARIFVLNGFRAEERALFAEHALIAVLNSPGEIAAFAQDAPGASAVHIDTGMNRLGLSLGEARTLAGDSGLRARIGLVHVMSHLACSDTPAHPMNRVQLERFRAVSALFEGVERSLSNTGGVLLGPDYHFDLIRPGIGLYGGSPVGLKAHPFEPVIRVETPILQLRRVAEGETVGYGAGWTAPRDSLTATVALGYADGLMRAAEGGFARIGGHKAQLVGRVSMDLCVLEVTGLDVRPGATAVFLGEDLEDLASAAGTIGYELITRLGRRFNRTFENG